MPQAIVGPIALAAFKVGLPLWVSNSIVGVGVGGAILYGGASLGVTCGASAAIAPLAIPRAAAGAEISMSANVPSENICQRVNG